MKLIFMFVVTLIKKKLPYLWLRKEPNSQMTGDCLVMLMVDMVNGDTYRSMITNYFVAAFHGIDVNEV